MSHNDAKGGCERERERELSECYYEVRRIRFIIWNETLEIHIHLVCDPLFIFLPHATCNDFFAVCFLFHALHFMSLDFLPLWRHRVIFLLFLFPLFLHEHDLKMGFRLASVFSKTLQILLPTRKRFFVRFLSISDRKKNTLQTYSIYAYIIVLFRCKWRS